MKESEITYIGGSSREHFTELKEIFDAVESSMGYLPNAYLTMAEKPELLKAFSNLAMTIFMSNEIDLGTKQLIALASSLSSGCKYCQAHTSHGAGRAGVKEQKIADILKYSESSEYSDSEKAVLDIAFASGQTPNQTNKEHFISLKKFSFVHPNKFIISGDILNFLATVLFIILINNFSSMSLRTK